MESNKNLVFLGMMGSGKTTLGKIVSKKLNKEFIDVDQTIEHQEGMVISEIFKKKGEPFFRILEEKMSLLSLKKKNSVIALGGGAFLNNKIQKEILKNHISIWLKWDNKNLIDRIKNSQKRPIAIKLSNIDLNKLINDRSKIYSKAKYQIKCDRLTKRELMERIIRFNDKG
jgi:shikimate kinase